MKRQVNGRNKVSYRTKASEMSRIKWLGSSDLSIEAAVLKLFPLYVGLQHQLSLDDNTSPAGGHLQLPSWCI